MMRSTALVAFHLRVGVRVALRTLAPLLAGATAAVVLYNDPAVVLAPLVALLYPPVPTFAAGLLAAAVSSTLAIFALPRLALGLGGWLRHLPASGTAHRRALTFGLVTAQTPWLLLAAVAGAVGLGVAPGVETIRLIGLGPCAWGSCLAAQRVRPASRAAAAAGAVAAFSGYAAALPAALALLAVAELTAGPLQRRPRPHSAVPPGARQPRPGVAAVERRAAALRLAVAIAWRALRWRLPAACSLALPVLLPAALFLHNNTLPPAHRVGAVRLAGLAAVVLVTTGMVEQLAKRRPPWPWVRSLPWSARARVACDAGLLLGVALPVVAAAAVLAPAALPATLATLPLLVVRGAAAVRAPRGSSWGASGPLLAEGMLAAMLVTLVPWLTIAALGLTPVAARAAVRAERRQTSSSWDELRHVAAGDPLSWSAE